MRSAESSVAHLGRIEISALINRLPQRINSRPVRVEIKPLAAFRTAHFARFVALISDYPVDSNDPYTTLRARYARAMNSRLFLAHEEIIASARKDACEDDAGK